MLKYPFPLVFFVSDLFRSTFTRKTQLSRRGRSSFGEFGRVVSGERLHTWGVTFSSELRGRTQEFTSQRGARARRPRRRTISAVSQSVSSSSCGEFLFLGWSSPQDRRVSFRTGAARRSFGDRPRAGPGAPFPFPVSLEFRRTRRHRGSPRRISY